MQAYPIIGPGSGSQREDEFVDIPADLSDGIDLGRASGRILCRDQLCGRY